MRLSESVPGTCSYINNMIAIGWLLGIHLHGSLACQTLGGSIDNGLKRAEHCAKSEVVEWIRES